MKTHSFVTATLILFGTLPAVRAATPSSPPGLMSPSLTTPVTTPATTPVTAPTPAAPRAQVDVPHVTSVSQAASVPAATTATKATAATALMPRIATDGRPTLGDWEDLANRQAFKDQSAKLNGDNGQQTQQPLQAALPPPPRMQQSQEADAPKKPRRASDSCGDGDAACFYAVYGMHVDGGPDNYHGLLAIDGLVQAVYKGKRFVTSHGRYTVKEISTHELSYIDPHGRVRTVPFSGEADVQADPTELKAEQKPGLGQPPFFGFQQR
ncbi:hypothetical protein [Paraburkholderia phytofirmans]|uniref:Uncharacterized protein n=1 Tax=Paraburkholderia phytofirmans (strain DSM 17436 / LMG 22146 / PsJN) TaxID=398527 RepID=B2TGY2_PARPJ|nr:hypothetical protein [Paraburkholderia phytofirmans]ACD21531.1 hypothetical protein Bphyt_7245 [Paraburkholderia phytofirmans PsJN]